MKILITTDDSDAKDTIIQAIDMCFPSSKVMFTDSGMQCVELARENSLDLIVLDTLLKDTGGFEALAQIRKFSNVPIMMISYSKEKTQLVKALMIGADEYLDKPIHFMEMLARIKALLCRANQGVKDNDTK